jgi:hypothetical protein
MTPQEWHAHVNGTLEAIVLACTSMIATHPEKQKVLALLVALSGHAAEETTDSPEIRSYKTGIRSAVSTMAKGVQNAELAEQVRTLKQESGSH